MGESQGYMPQPDRLDWGTPQAVFDYANETFGSFAIDLAASGENTKCTRFISEDNNALEGSWQHLHLSGKVGWLNPPYGRMLKPFVLKVIKELEAGNIKRVVMLVPSRTDTIWFNSLVPYSKFMHFFKGRLKFEGSNNSAPFASVLIVLEKNPQTRIVEWGLKV